MIASEAQEHRGESADDARVTDERPETGSFPIVGVGASAGGLEAFSDLLAHLPESTGMAFVLVQHLDPRYESKLTTLLTKVTRLRILEATQGLAVRPNHVYVIPKNTTMTIVGGILQLAPRGEVRALHLPIDLFLRSLAEDRQTGAIGVILSGTGSDGMLGMEEIKAAGGLTFAQDEKSAKYPGMPQSAVKSGCVDVVLPPKEIAHELARIGQHPYVAPALVAERGAASPVAEEDHFKRILAILRSAFGVDFTAYRDTTIKRRIMRRMVVHTKDSLAEYAQHLERDKAELEALYQDILINVTSFFRQPETFEALKQSAFPEILKAKDPDTPIRIWAPGCSTGQEAYSLAITLLEFLDERPARPPIQVFATDLSDTVSLVKAREGVYPENIEAEVSPERLRRFFTKEDAKYRVIKPLRDMCVFAKQNVAADPPFSHLDLISCRNLLIYLAPPLQKRVIPTFHYALNPVGFLMLGASETVGPFGDLFGVVDHKHRIYAKKATAVRQYPHFNAEDLSVAVTGPVRGTLARAATAADWQREADRIVIGQYAPVGVLVNDDLDVLQFRGQTGPYLAPAPGEPSHNLLKLAREGLLLELYSAVNECRKQDAPVQRQGVRVRSEDSVREINLRVLPMKLAGSAERCFLVLFEETGPGAAAVSRPSRPGPKPQGLTRWLPRWLRHPPSPAAASGNAGTSALPDDRDVAHLRKELASTREYLQSVIGQQDTANEELKAANEEVLSSNEELQSTNEELETAKEELQSVNEELTTVNEQLQNRNQELSRLNDDFTNLLGSGNVPMVALGIDLRIRLFTAAAGKVLNLLPTDVGHPIRDLKLTVEVPDLEVLLTEVIDTVQVRKREVRDREGRWYELRIHPYRTGDNKIEGAVLVLVDIDEAKVSELRYRRLFESAKDGILILHPGTRKITDVNPFLIEFLGYSREEFLGKELWQIGLVQDEEASRAVFRELQEHGYVHYGDLPLETKTGERREVEVLGNLYREDGDEVIQCNIRDITERKRAEAELRESEERFRRLVQAVKDYAIFMLDPAGRITSWNEGAERVLGYPAEEIIGQHFRCFFTAEDQQAGKPEHELQRAETEGRAEADDWRVCKGGGRFWASGVMTPSRDEAGRLCGFVKVMHDTTERKRAEEDLKEADRRKCEFMAMLSHELRNPLAAINNAVQLSGQAEGDADTAKWSQDVIERQVKNLIRLVDDLLDVARVTQGKVWLRKEPVEVAELISRAVAMVRHQIDARKHELSIALPQEPVHLYADATRLEQTLANLLSNAVKYTEPGGRIGLEVEQLDKELVISVRDTGVGIPPEILPHVFDPFTQVDRTIGRAEGGLGIGLTLVRSFVERHGGSVSVASTLGAGSVFTVRLPLGDGTPIHRPEPKTRRAEAPTRRSRILIVDDNMDSARGMARLLTQAGHEVHTAYDGPSAIEAALSQKPEFVLLDIGLPGMSGYEIAARLRREEDLKGTIIIAVSGYGQGDDRRRSREAGFDHHLVKPVNHDQLLSLLE